MEKKLDVKNLQISFRTQNGKVQAVRDISFSLDKGETLAIVGESGSGKSVTSKAILGILAGNAIIEGGEILYDGKDLLKIHEDEFYRIRGDKIAMIFQDPLSSLNPIMRIGKQLTEAMILKGKARQKSSRDEFNKKLAVLNAEMVEAIANGNKEKADQLTKDCKNFNEFEVKHTKLEQAYNDAIEAANEAIDSIDNALFLIEKKAFKTAGADAKAIAALCKRTVNPFVVEDSTEIKSLAKVLPVHARREAKEAEFSATKDTLNAIKAVLTPALQQQKPDFFTMGYYLTFVEKELPKKNISEMNSIMHDRMEKDYMIAFVANVKTALMHSAEKHYGKKQLVVDKINKELPLFTATEMDVAACKQAVKEISAMVEDSIDRLEINKDSMAYTFGSAIDEAMDAYLNGGKRNKEAQARHDKQQAKYDRLIAKNKTPDWQVVPAATIDLKLARKNIVIMLTQLADHYKEQIASKDKRDYDKETEALIDFFKVNASGAVFHVSKGMAKLKALKLMEEVGIPEPRRRYKQYPFEFSGGMRQRIVIAIALAANPDILICDEPTTALDVTIQAQILELINSIKKERQLSIIFITHDLGVVANMADRIAVMYAGKIVEYGSADDIFYAPAHPYTWALLSSMPDLDTNEKLEAIPGTPPNMIYPPVGDAFAERNKYAMKIDFEEQPPMFPISDTHFAATWLLHPDAPHVDPPKIVTDRIKRMKNLGGEINE